MTPLRVCGSLVTLLQQNTGVVVVAASREVRVGKIDMVFSHCIAITIEHTHIMKTKQMR